MLITPLNDVPDADHRDRRRQPEAEGEIEVEVVRLDRRDRADAGLPALQDAGAGTASGCMIITITSPMNDPTIAQNGSTMPLISSPRLKLSISGTAGRKSSVLLGQVLERQREDADRLGQERAADRRQRQVDGGERHAEHRAEAEDAPAPGLLPFDGVRQRGHALRLTGAIGNGSFSTSLVSRYIT